MTKTYRSEKVILRDGGIHYGKIYYKPKGYHSYIEMQVCVDSEKRKGKRRFRENDFCMITNIIRDVKLPDDAEECYGIDVPKCCRDTFELLDNSWEISYE